MRSLARFFTRQTTPEPPMSLHLVTTAVLDAHDADEESRRELLTDYLAAIQAGDVLAVIRIEALAADYDMRHPGETPVLAEFDGLWYPAAA